MQLRLQQMRVVMSVTSRAYKQLIALATEQCVFLPVDTTGKKHIILWLKQSRAFMYRVCICSAVCLLKRLLN